MNSLTPEQQVLSDEAIAFVKSKSAEFKDEFCGTCLPVEQPVSLFMAGSPGAGKTEVSKGLMRQFDTVPVRIDADEIRARCPGYEGSNAHVFQQAANKGVNILFDYALDKKLHLILDGTFAYGGWNDNISRSIKRGRLVEVWFIYQDPLKAWEFTKAREAIEARHVDKEAFIKAFILAKYNVIEAKKAYKDKLTLNLLIKEISNKDGETKLNVQADQLDGYIGASYTEAELNSIIL